MVSRLTLAVGSILFGIANNTPSCQAQGNVSQNYPAGPMRSTSFFPIAVWWQQANGVGHSGSFPTIAAAAAAARINIMLGQGENWPEAFGADQGEFEAIQQNHLYLIGGIGVPWSENTSNKSVASILALAKSLGASANLVGYNAGDEPQCTPGYGQTAMSQVPSVIAGIHSFDPTRLVTFNETAWTVQPQWQTHPAGCLGWDEAALKATNVASADLYPITSPYIATQLGVTGTDYKSLPNDSLWVQGLVVQSLAHFKAANQPLWVYIEAGGDNFGLSEANASFPGAVNSGSTTLTSLGPSRFTSTWIGLQVSGAGISPGSTIVSIADPQHAVMSRAASASSNRMSVAVTGGTYGDCVGAANLCVVNGNEYRPTSAQVAAEVWLSLINGANGIEYFCHDIQSYSFCLYDTAAGGLAAARTWGNLAYIDSVILSHAPVLNAPTVGQCSMDQLNYMVGNVITRSSCTGGDLTMTTNNPAVPGAALVKSLNGVTFLIAQSTRRSQGGAKFSFKIPSMAGHTATMDYDSNQRYAPVHINPHATFRLDATGSFSDGLGQFADYQVKIYKMN